VAWDGETLLVADLGNDKVRRVDPAAGLVTTVLDARAGLAAPVALACHGRRLFVADGAGPRILVHDLDRQTCEEWRVPDDAPAPVLPELRLRAAADCVVEFRLALPRGERVHPQTGVRVRLANAEGRALAVDLTYEATIAGEFAVLRGVTTGEPGAGTITAAADYLTCVAADGAAHPQRLRRRARLLASAEGPTTAVWLPD
jgi:hypothetical protein